MELDIATIASSGNIQIAALSVVAWFSKSLIGLAAKGLAAFTEDRAQTHVKLDKSDAHLMELLTESKKTNDLLQQMMVGQQQIINGQHEISNILMYNIPPSKVISDKKVSQNV